MLPTPPTPTPGSPVETQPPVTSNLSSDAIGNFLRAHFGTENFDQQDFPERIKEGDYIYDNVTNTANTNSRISSRNTTSSYF